MLLISHWLPPSNMHFLTRQLSCSNDGYVHTQQPLAALYSVHIMCLLMACLNIFLHKASQESCVQLFKSLDNFDRLLIRLFSNYLGVTFSKYFSDIGTFLAQFSNEGNRTLLFTDHPYQKCLYEDSSSI